MFIATKTARTRLVEKMEQTPKPAEAPKPRNRTVLYAIIGIVLIVVGVGVYFLTQTSSGYNVAIQDDSACAPNAPACLFKPASVNATVSGSAIVWKNIGGVTHTVTTCDSTNGASLAQCPSGANAPGLDSFAPNVAAGGTTSHVFAKAGTYYYYCSIHPWMHATVIAK